jgi:hypothetical protein
MTMFKLSDNQLTLLPGLRASAQLRLLDCSNNRLKALLVVVKCLAHSNPSLLDIVLTSRWSQASSIFSVVATSWYSWLLHPSRRVSLNYVN